MLCIAEMPANLIGQAFFASNLPMKKEEFMRNVVQSAKKNGKKEKSTKFRQFLWTKHPWLFFKKCCSIVTVSNCEDDEQLQGRILMKRQKCRQQGGTYGKFIIKKHL